MRLSVRQIIRRAAGSTYLRHNAIYLGGSMLVAFLNYLYYPVLGRLLTAADFGEVQVIISFYLQAGVFFLVLGMVTIGILKKYDQPEERRAVTVEIEWLAMLISLGGFVLIVAFSPWLARFLHFDSVVPFILFACSVLLGAPLALSNAYLQGHRRFAVLAWSNIVAAFTKLVLSAGLVMAGWGTNGALLGLALSSAVNAGYTQALAAKVGRPGLWLRRRWPDLTRVRPELRFAGMVLLTSLTVNVILSLDILTVKHFFSPTVAGLYAAISTVSRTLFFLTGPLTVVLVASVTLQNPVHNRQLLRRSLMLAGLLGGGTLIVFSLFPYLVVRLMMGPRYLAFAGQLPALSLAVFMLSIANMVVSYQVSLRRSRVMPAALLSFAIMATLLVLQHNTIPEVVHSMMEGSAVTLILVTLVSRRKGTPATV